MPNIESREEIAYYLVRSMDRLKALTLQPLDRQGAEYQKKLDARTEWVEWHDLLVRKAQQVGLLPEVVMTARTELGKKHGAASEVEANAN